MNDLTAIDEKFNELWERLAEAPHFHQRTEIIRWWIEKQHTKTSPKELMLSSYLSNSLPARSVAELSEILCYSTRQLHRKSYEFFGMSTEALLHYKRYISSLHLLNGEFSLTAIAYQCGFYDQSHFIRNFRQYTDMTPTEYKRVRSDIAGHLFT